MQLGIKNEYKEGIKLYNAQRTSSEMLKNNFVIRLNEYGKIWKAISNTKMINPEQHYIVQAVSGSGKTTLLNRLALQVKNDRSTSKWLIPIVFKEEEYSITSLFTLWERVCEELQENHGSNFKELLEKVQTQVTRDHKQAIDELNASLSNAKKKVIIFIDNIVELISNFTVSEQDDLRKILITNNNIRLIGGATRELEGFHHNGKSSNRIFNVVPLEGLNKEESITLLKRLSEYKGKAEQEQLNYLLINEPEKIESIRRLTDGIPRIMSILFNILMDGPKGPTFELLEETMDQATPLYKHRMRNLSKQQKLIVNAIALNWDAISTKEIANATYLPSKQISAQLSQLEKQQLIKKIPTNTKNHLYALRERFFNIWYLMSYGNNKSREKMLWLTRFFETWCSDLDQKREATKLIEQAGKSIHPQASLMVANALTCSNFLEPETKSFLFSKITEALQLTESGKQNVPVSSGDIKEEDSTEKTGSLFGDFFNTIGKIKQDSVEIITELLDRKNNQAKTMLQELHNESLTKNTELSLKEAPSEYNNVILGTFYCESERYEEALSLLTPYQGNNATVSALLSNVYYHISEYMLSEQYAKKAINLGNNNALLELAFSLLYQQQYQDTINTFNQLLDSFPHINAASIHCMIGITHKEAGDFELAEASFLKSFNLAPHDKIPYVELADLYMKQAKFSDTEACFNTLIELGNFAYWDELIQLHIFNKDIVAVEETIEMSLNTNYLDAYNTAAWRCFESRFQAKKALKYSSKAVSLTPNIETFHTNVAVSLWNNNVELATKSMDHFLNNYVFEIKNNESGFLQLFTLFLAKGHTQLVEKWLTEHKLTNRFKPLHYALMSLMKDKYPNEILRMGGELKETVNEVLLEVETLAKKYK